MNGISFLKFLQEKEYLPKITVERYENPDLHVVLGNMLKTELLSETYLVAYLNEWGELPIEIVERGATEITLTTDIVFQHEDLEKYFITPISAQSMRGGGMQEGGIITFIMPFKSWDLIRPDYIRNCLKPVYQTSAWKINIEYALEDICSSLYYKYAIKFVDSSLQMIDSLNLRQKIQKVFRDAVRSDTMDIVFLLRKGKMEILRKYMNEFHPYTGVTFSAEELSNFKNMMIGVIGGVHGVKINSEPSLDFKINNLNEDGLYEGRVNFMETKDGFQFHIRIIKLAYNKMKYNDYYLVPPVRADVEDMLTYTSGLCLVTGPRGSGKQVFLYTAINEFLDRRPNSYIETLEDPVEARLEGNIGQVEIDIANGRDFIYYLRGIKRHSTSMYVIGELRDRETVEAALTEGASAALVLTTTHCPDCAGVIKKMSMELKGDDSMLIKLLNEFKVVVNLTMAMKACPECSTLVSRENLTLSEVKFLDSWNYQGRIYKQHPGGEGCESCKKFNYGKINKLESNGNLYAPLIIAESLKFDSSIMEIVGTYNNTLEQENAIRNKMIREGRYKAQIALALMNSRLITLEECMRHFQTNVYCDITRKGDEHEATR